MKRLLPVLMGFVVLLLSSTEGWSLPPCPAERHPTNSPWSDCFGTYAYASGDEYVGEWKDNQYHGQGTETYPNGSKYAGEYKNGKRHGDGTYTYAYGDKYVGEWKDGKKHGQGTYTFAKSEKNNLPNGQGIQTFADGRVRSA